MSNDHPQLADLLKQYIGRANTKPDRLAKSSGVPKSTIVRWLRGETAKPRTWDGVVRIAIALSLSELETTKLLHSVGYPSVAELMTNATGKERELFSPWVKPTFVRLSQVLDLIEERRRQAEDWKQLHQECQDISVRLVYVREIMPSGKKERDPPLLEERMLQTPEEEMPQPLEERALRSTEERVQRFVDERALQLLYTYWLNECSGKIRRFIEFERLPDRVVKRDFMSVNQNQNWTDELRREAQKVNYILGQSLTVGEFQKRASLFEAALRGLEKTSCQVLEFLDGRLQRTLKELDSDIGKARTNFTQVKSFMD
jgi:transcriptional regulator with XRE-family HTH domain